MPKDKNKAHSSVPTPSPPEVDRPWATRPHRIPVIFIRAMVEILNAEGKGEGIVAAQEFPLTESQIPEEIWTALERAGLSPKR